MTARRSQFSTRSDVLTLLVLAVLAALLLTAPFVFIRLFE